MASSANSLLALVVVALGLIGIILSFLVPDRKKAQISLILAGLIVAAGAIRLVSESYTQFTWNRRLRNLQRDRQVDFDQLRDQMKQRAAQTPPAAEAPKKK